MRIRDLKRKSGGVVIDVWPPLWTSAFRQACIHPSGDQGVLESVERAGDRLTLRMRFGDRVHLGSLEWLPTVAEVEAVLLANLGEPIGRIGDLAV